MPTHAELASKLLADAAEFFRNLGDKNDEINGQMVENAEVFVQMSELLSQSPDGKIDDKSHGDLAGRLLKDAATFFRTLAEQNEPIKEQMLQNADVYDQIGDLVAEDPMGIMD